MTKENQRLSKNVEIRLAELPALSHSHAQKSPFFRFCGITRACQYEGMGEDD